MKRAERVRTYQSKEHVKERHAENMRNTHHSTKTTRQAVPVDVSAKMVISPKMKHAEINRTYQSREHVKERRANTQRNTRHSTKTTHQAADVDGIIKGMKKKRANKKQRYQESKYLQEHGAELLRRGRAEVDGD